MASDITHQILEILSEAKKLARRYRILTGKPLGVTGEVAEFEASRILGLELTEARTAGFDAIRYENGNKVRLQVKGRCILPGSKPGQRMGKIEFRTGQARVRPRKSGSCSVFIDWRIRSLFFLFLKNRVEQGKHLCCWRDFYRL